MTWLNNIINSVDMSLSKFWELVEDREAWCQAFSNLVVLAFGAG